MHWKSGSKKKIAIASTNVESFGYCNFDECC